jgi:hypothetical protein
MTNRIERYPLIQDVISGYRRPGIGPVMGTPLWERSAAPRQPVVLQRPEIPRTRLSISALSTAERAVLRRVAATVAVELDSAERLHSSPMRQTSQSILAATAAEDVDRLRRRAREVIEEHRTVL